MGQWCRSCHTSSLTGADRNGAPADINFDTEAEVMALADIVVSQAANVPGGGPSDADLRLLSAWLQGCP